MIDVVSAFEIPGKSNDSINLKITLPLECNRGLDPYSCFLQGKVVTAGCNTPGLLG